MPPSPNPWEDPDLTRGALGMQALDTSAVTNPPTPFDDEGLRVVGGGLAAEPEYDPGIGVPVRYSGPCSVKDPDGSTRTYGRLTTETGEDGTRRLPPSRNVGRCPVVLAPMRIVDDGSGRLVQPAVKLQPGERRGWWDLDEKVEFVAAVTWCSGCPCGRFLVTVERPMA